MKKLALIGCEFVAVVCSSLSAYSENEIRVSSPDGRNQIVLKTDALAYEVRRDGVEVVSSTPIGMTVNGHRLEGKGTPFVAPAAESGFLDTPVYKKSRIDLSANSRFVDWGDWGIRLIARNDGVAYRFETKMSGDVRIDGETAGVNVPDDTAEALVYYTSSFGRESTVPEFALASRISHQGKDRGLVYLPLTYSLGGKVVSISDADVRDYPVWYLKRDEASSSLKLDSVFASYPKVLTNDSGVDREQGASRERRWKVKETDTYLVHTSGTRSFPWRAFALADSYAKLCESDLIPALATPAAERDWSWVRPGKVAWDWWNAFDNIGDPQGCTTKTYERFIDFAAKNGIEYVIMDEGWSEKLNIWKFRKEVDVPHLIRYASERQVGIILWMAWAQVEGDEERVAEEFARLGVKGFKVDFIDRGDAQVSAFLWKFSEECAKRKLLIDYHGIHRPTGLTRTYPNVLTFESIYGLEQMKWYENKIDMPYNDVAAFFGRQTGGPMDYTPGAMDNYPVGHYPEIKVRPARKDKIFVNPGSVGTRCHQMAMMVMYESPLQMLSDSPTKYEKNMECFSFMAKTPVVWKETVGLGGAPDSYAACARRGDEDVWYVAALNGAKARTTVLDTAFLGKGEWMVESFSDDGESSSEPTRYRHAFSKLKAGESLSLAMSEGGGFVARLTRPATENIVIPKEALDPKGGHIQGIALGDDGSIYVSQTTQLTKLDKSGKAVATKQVINHTGDVTWWNGELYTAVAVQPANKEGRIEVFDKDLNLVRSTVIDRAIDGIACLDGVLYVGMGAKVQPSKNAHRVNILGRFDAKTLKELAPRQDFDYGYETHYGFQDIASDGQLLYATFYAVKGAPRMAIFDRDGRVIGVGNDGSNNGFDFLPDHFGILVNENGVLSVKSLPSIRNGK